MNKKDLNISDVIDGIVIAEKYYDILESYYDAWGLCLSIAILKDNRIALSSKHWLKNYYIECDNCDWDIIKDVAKTIDREISHNSHDTTYVYITNLNREQTTNVYNLIVSKLREKQIDFDVSECFEFTWQANKNNCVLFSVI